MYEIEGNAVIVRRKFTADERHEFSSETEARLRVRFMEEMLTWVGTPFVDCADVKGPNGGTDCVMSMARSSIDAGLRDEFDPRPYSPAHMIRRSEEQFLNYLRDKLGCVEVEKPQLGDIFAWHFGKCFAHGGVMVNNDEICHAAKPYGGVIVSLFKRDPLLVWARYRGKQYPRPVKYFNYYMTWKGA